jgi:hypothetical protein
MKTYLAKVFGKRCFYLEDMEMLGILEWKVKFESINLLFEVFAMVKHVRCTHLLGKLDCLRARRGGDHYWEVQNDSCYLSRHCANTYGRKVY